MLSSSIKFSFEIFLFRIDVRAANFIWCNFWSLYGALSSGASCLFLYLITEFSWGCVMSSSSTVMSLSAGCMYLVLNDGTCDGSTLWIFSKSWSSINASVKFSGETFLWVWLPPTVCLIDESRIDCLPLRVNLCVDVVSLRLKLCCLVMLSAAAELESSISLMVTDGLWFFMLRLATDCIKLSMQQPWRICFIVEIISLPSLNSNSYSSWWRRMPIAKS